MPAVNIPDEIYNEFILRSGRSVNVERWIISILEDFLAQTKFDNNIWSGDYLEKLEENKSRELVKKVGQPDKGFHWKALFLPNGTLMKMHYGDRDFIAEVRHQFIYFNEKSYNSPSLLASQIASNTSRNAWRDFYIKRPEDKKFMPALYLRLNRKAKN